MSRSASVRKTDVQPFLRQVAPRPTYAALADSWLLTLEAENKSPATINNYAIRLTAWVRWLAANQHPLDPADATTRLVREFLAETTRTLSAQSARARWVGLRSFFSWAFAEDEITTNPMVDVNPPKVGEKMMPMLSDDEMKALVKACQGPYLQDRRDEALVLLFADSAGRLAEITRAELVNLDLRGRTLLVLGKGNRERVIPFGTTTAKAIDRYLRLRARTKHANSPALWISARDFKPMTTNAVQQMFRRRGRQAGIEQSVHPHMLRHGFADKWLEGGGSETALMDIAGWRSRQMLGRYGAARREARARTEYQGRSPMDNL